MSSARIIAAVVGCLLWTAPAEASTLPASWAPAGLSAGPLPQSLSLMTARSHGPDENTDPIPEGGFSFKKRKNRKVIAGLGAGLMVVGLFTLAGARTAGIEAEDAPTDVERTDWEKKQQVRRTSAYVMLGAGGTAVVVDLIW